MYSRHSKKALGMKHPVIEFSYLNNTLPYSKSPHKTFTDRSHINKKNPKAKWS